MAKSYRECWPEARPPENNTGSLKTFVDGTMTPAYIPRVQIAHRVALTDKARDFTTGMEGKH